MKYLFTAVLLYNAAIQACAQTQQYKVAIAAFYNCENFYDTINDAHAKDEEFLPGSSKHYNSRVYHDKVDHLANVIARIGTELNPDGPALLGVSEIENEQVLNDLVQHPLLRKRHYQVVHYDSRDARGVDVALLFNPVYFTLQTSRALPVAVPSGSYTYYSRDILWVKGLLDGECIQLYINHWPSRRGGEEKSLPARKLAAAICKHHLDSLQALDNTAKCLVMGDLNDDPVSPSITEVLHAREKQEAVKDNDLYNPWISLYKKGIGTLAYQDAWGLFDQIMLNKSWLDKTQPGFFYYQAHVFSQPFLTETSGRYKGYPMRTWDGNNYRGGYSDHFPTYVVLLKRIAQH
ncbi:endonuclease/exonuclease/phosphatase family protein [Deminuibacter soli]|uniref:Endonuclease/exonuclease/phosphatase family protein n=1 Tax=Deminuibacter soli TaxID=2291815 RepID=A0A3E1NLI4_9BACT|nr:endonuclease/exonuclease/phosphatase family protein [Deminuibacter soli]RFM28786.1 endonuclease/exonuclease/phosphatase family protein [Deminuibacter soli]